MNSRMTFGGDFSFPADENVPSMPPWVPVTPQKPNPLKSHPILLNPHGNHLQGANWLHQLQNVQIEESSMSQTLSPQVPRYGGYYSVNGGLGTQNGMINEISGSYSQLLGSDSSSWRSFTQLLEDNAASAYVGTANMNLSRSVDIAANAPPTPKLHAQVANPGNNSSSFVLTNRHRNNGSYPSSTVKNRPVVVDFPFQFNSSSGESNAANWLLNNENHCSSSNLLSNGDNSAHISQYVFPTPFQPSYDLNSLPRTEANSTSCIPSQLQFTTNEAKHLENHQFMASQKSLTCESASKGKEKQLDYFISTEGVAIDDHGGELLQNIVDSASAGNSTPYKEIRDSDHESERFLDLNKTPQQKPPKKRKHRPKVIREGKPKRTPKRATPNNTEPKDPRTGKRKYVRRNLQKGSSSQLVDSTRDSAYNNPGIGAKSCRRVLDFDLKKTTDGKQGKASDQKEEMQQGNIRTFGFQGTDMATRISCVSKLKSVELIDLENDVVVEKKIPRIINQPRSSINYIPSNYIIIPEEQESAAPVATTEDMQSRNLHVTKGNADSGISELCRTRCGLETTTMPQCRHVEGIGKNNGENRERIEDTVIQSACQSALKVIPPPNERTGSKRVHSHNIQPTHTSHNNLPCSFLCEETFEVDGSQENNCTISKEFSESQKKQKFEQGYLSIYDKLSKVATMEESLGRVGRKRANDANINGFAAALNHTILNSYIGINRKAEKQSSGINKFASARFIESIASENNSPKKQFPSKLNSSYQEITQVHSLSAHSTIETCDPLISSPPGKSRRRGKKQVLQNHGSKSATKLTKGPTLSTSLLSVPDKVLQEQDALYDHQQSSAKTLGTPKRTIYPSVMDDIIHRFNGLSIDGNCNTIVEQEKNALVPYKGDGAVVPYEGEFIKKRKPRPKVELDSETSRIWNLLMGKEGCEGNEGPDKVKEKFWEEERKVFQGRVDSFIARMHLVQGDRRFSRWKGSVVDSVVGVFLTQNVSDHLSSSAFMSLAARFPLQSKRNHQAQDKVGTNILAEEPGVRITIPDDATECHEVTSQPIYNKISMTPNESADQQRHRETSRTESNIGDVHSQLLEEEFLSSQDSFGSSVTQGTVGIRSYSVSNSETEGPTAGCKPDKVHRSISAYQPMNKATAFQEFYLQATGSSLLDDGSKPRHMTRSDRIDDFCGTSPFRNPINLENRNMQPSVSPYSSNHMHTFLNSGESEPFVWESFSEESISSSTASRFNTAKDDSRKSVRNKEFLGSNVGSSVDQNNLWKSQEMATRDPYEALRKHSTDQKNYSQPRSRDEYTQPSCGSHQHDGKQTFLSDNTSFIKPVKHTEPLPGKKNDILQHVPAVNQLKKKSSDAGDSISKVKKQMNSENGLVHSNPEEQFSSYGQPHSEITTNISKGRKGKAESENKNAVDWDNLRKQVLADGRKKDRNEDAMDSLDYEALINANVKEISHAIRERGMNNMLAERIQEFLNRVVKDHGSIDLEWLRDVPPDKAKDYLLSIRGLGLKSVECVRLLTLHHLAFPVDTNVGRIAVRLGWVPLQPLPESLQLHLLELYPMLESIQKYLWPRLCKLDQLTLYELHYQMITFGKVFCTKSKPNCNACPMRGECRHFASAFASARLALPGPEDKSIVSSTTSTVAEKSPTMTGNIMSLPPPENNLLQQVSTYADNCQPIIEEPATPEQEFGDLPQSDIEDLSYEDPDEIPTIQLNIEEFTETLQNYMHKNMELQEGDMSKALVALNPEAASLPASKLKNVSRLRTEHQVYELPDSHPLLQGMDRREPDDPSPYLLAIWTPGETANSVQPPESRCGSQDENKLCNEKTCFSCNSIREENSQIVRGTILIPCRTAMRGSFPLNGTYFQVNEMFADHDSSDKPIDVPRGWIWNLPRRTVYFGTSVSSIFKGLTTEGIQYCFWRGYVCVRGFDRTSRAPRPLIARLHFPASRMTIMTRNEKQGDKKSPRRREGFHQGKAD